MARKKRWFKTYVSITDNFLWKLPEPFDKRSAFIDLIALAEPYGGKKYYVSGGYLKINKGEIATSISDLAHRWYWGRHEVTKYLALLEREGMAKATNYNGVMVIEVTNYTKYQNAKTNMFNDFRQRNNDLNEIVESENYAVRV